MIWAGLNFPEVGRRESRWILWVLGGYGVSGRVKIGVFQCGVGLKRGLGHLCVFRPVTIRTLLFPKSSLFPGRLWQSVPGTFLGHTRPLLRVFGAGIITQPSPAQPQCQGHTWASLVSHPGIQKGECSLKTLPSPDKRLFPRKS